MWTHEFKPLSDDERDRLGREGIKISIAGLRNYVWAAEIKKMDRYNLWKELQREVLNAQRNVVEYEALLDETELNQFKEQYRSEKK